jgi:hypothetical protein
VSFGKRAAFLRHALRPSPDAAQPEIRGKIA